MSDPQKPSPPDWDQEPPDKQFPSQAEGDEETVDKDLEKKGGPPTKK